ncbi:MULTISPECIES: iron-containing alcohol dehydrogenase [Nocardioides]|uniref:Iron-containing alcohol dehydrogenase n=1 Tax=Nocardioides vastitatis TaxID=2568655 RepID=A0ABW0ZQN4_9ACTN|nr:iron-containing alcohol dehydrogenase [Nocardioides sp.]THJ05720.1 iron-containing alcohol dehydrogenase [Nocardioides sp.]
MVASIALPRMLRIGAGAVTEAADVASTLGVTRPLLVTDPFMVVSGTADLVLNALKQGGLDAALFSETVPDPTTDSLAAGVAAIAHHQADALIGLGGGSPIDTAKALALLSKQGGHMRDYKAPKVNLGPVLPVIAIPTTSGSGSEATQFTVITDSANSEKMLCIGLGFLPAAAIIDFELTESMPARLTADTGVDALCHAIEAYVSRKANPFSDSMAMAAITAIGRNLRRVYADGHDRDAREAMMLASLEAGIAFSNASVTLIHGMSRPIGGNFQVAHGLSNAMLLPAVTAFSVGGAEDRYAQVARALGVASDATADAHASLALVDEVTQLCADLHVPTPEAHGISREKWDALTPVMAQQALASGSPANNPVVPTADDIESLYAKIFS